MKNFFNQLPTDLTDEVFDVIVEDRNIKIERIVSDGHSSPDTGWYQQNTNEWVMVLQGQAELGFVDGSSVKLGYGDHLLIPAGQKHKVNWTDPSQPTLWLAVHY